MIYDNKKHISISGLDDQTDIIDFDEIRKAEEDIYAQDKDAEDEFMLDEDGSNY